MSCTINKNDSYYKTSGRTLAVGGTETPCARCGASVSFPVGVKRMDCPHCHSEMERVGWT
jgi:hypothetical protein